MKVQHCYYMYHILINQKGLLKSNIKEFEHIRHLMEVKTESKIRLNSLGKFLNACTEYILDEGWSRPRTLTRSNDNLYRTDRRELDRLSLEQSNGLVSRGRTGRQKLGFLKSKLCSQFITQMRHCNHMLCIEVWRYR